MKKRALFVISNLGTGGVNSSLSALYNNMSEFLDIHVLPLSFDGDNEFSFKDRVLDKLRFVDAYSCDFDKCEPRDRVFKSFVKLLKWVTSLLNIDLEAWLSKCAIKKLEKRFSFDTVVAFQEGPATRFVRHFRNSNKIAWVHSDYLASYPNSDASVYQKYSKIVFVSKYTRDVFNEKYPQYLRKTTYIYNYLNAQHIIDLSIATLHDPMFSREGFKIISMGRIVELKRFSRIPEIADKIRKKGINFNWYILGPSTAKTEYDRLVENIKEYKVEGCVHLMGDKTNPFPYLRKSDLYVSLSTTEACPMVFNEARILGIPIISTDFGSSFEFIKNGYDGFIGPIEDIYELISKMISDEEVYMRIKKNVSRFYFDNDIITNQIINIIENESAI